MSRKALKQVIATRTVSQSRLSCRLNAKIEGNETVVDSFSRSYVPV
jgi:hypothetical protein